MDLIDMLAHSIQKEQNKYCFQEHTEHFPR